MVGKSKRRARGLSITSMAAAAGMALSLALTACGSGGSAGGAVSEPAMSVTAEASAMSVTAETSGKILVMGSSDVAVEQPVIDAFNQAFPNIEVEYRHIPYEDTKTALRTALTANDGPDVFETEVGAIDSLYNKFTVDLVPLLEDTLGLDWRDKVNMGAIEPFMHDGKLSALSSGVQGGGTIEYNADILDELGLKYPANLAQWKQVCSAIEAAGTTCVVQGGKDGWANQDVFHSIANSIAPGKFNQAVAGEIEWTDPDLVAAFESFGLLFDELYPSDAVATTTYPDAMNKFLKGEAAMISMGGWDAANYNREFLQAAIDGAGASNAAFTVLHAPFPNMKASGAAEDINTLWDESMLYADPANSFSINAKSKNLALAKAYVAFKTLSPAAAQIWADKLNTVPTLKGLTVAPEVKDTLVSPDVQFEIANKLLESMSRSADARSIANPDLVTALTDAMSAIAAGTKSPADAAQDLQDAASQISG